jgi:hypothetical protein
MTLLEAILLRAGWTPRQLGMPDKIPPAELSNAPLHIRGIIDTKPGRVLSRSTERVRRLRAGRKSGRQ